MSVRSRIRPVMERVIGSERTDRVRSLERSVRHKAAHKLSPGAPAPSTASARPAVRSAPAAKSKWRPSDPVAAAFPEPTHSNHELLAGLHERLKPQTYLEVGIRWGDSLALSRCTSVGIDPEFKVTHELHGTMHLERTTSDEFFARENPLAVFEGRAVDLAFIDGMHLSEFALRDFMNVERHMSAGGVVVFDDMLPRNALEAARDRKTEAWAGDVYKVIEILREHRPDLAVLPVNTRPTGTLVVIGLDPTSTVLWDRYDSLVPRCEAPDPQNVPHDLLSRSSAVEPKVLLDSVDWSALVAFRGADPDPSQRRAFVESLADLPRVG